MSKESKPIPDVAHYGTGAIQSRGFTLDGEMHGKWEFFRKDGSLMRSGQFDCGRQVGIWRTLDRTGKLVKETYLSSGFGGSSLPGQELLRHTEVEMEEREAPKTYVQPDVPERGRRRTLRWFLWTGAIVAAIVVASFLLR